MVATLFLGYFSSNISFASAIQTEWDKDGYVVGSYYYTEDFSYGSNITITTGSELYLANLTMNINENILIKVEGGGLLKLDNIFIKSNMMDDYRLAIQIQKDGNFTLTNSKINCIGWVGQDENYESDRSSIFCGENSTITIKNNEFAKFTPYNGKFISLYKPGKGNVVIKNNTFHGDEGAQPSYENAFYLLEPYSNFQFTFDNNTFRNCKPLYFYQASNIQITNNHILHTNQWWDNAIVLEACNNIVLQNNSLRNSKYLVDIYGSDYIHLINNSFSNSENYVVCNGISDNVTFSNNTFTYSDLDNVFETDSLISFSGSNYSLNGNLFSVEKLDTSPEDITIFDFYSLNTQGNLLFSETNPNYLNGKTIKLIQNIDTSTTLDFSSEANLGYLLFRNVSNALIENVQTQGSGGINLVDGVSNVNFTNINIQNSVTGGIRSQNFADYINIKNSQFQFCKGAGIQFQQINYGNFSGIVSRFNKFGIRIDYGYKSVITQSNITYNGDISQSCLGKDGEELFLGIGAGILIDGGYGVNITDNNVYQNWYGGLVLGANEYGFIENFLVSQNNLGQYINIQDKKYGISAIDNSKYEYGSTSYTNWINNAYSEVNNTDSSQYNIPGVANCIDNSPIFTDQDLDGVSNIKEFVWGANYINSADTDQDGVSDYDEIMTYQSNPNATDTDGDGLNDEMEIREEIGSDPTLYDTDGDGYNDYYEWLQGYSPTDPEDYPGKNIDERDVPDSQYREPENLISIPGFPASWLLFFSLSIIGIFLFNYKKNLHKSPKREGRMN